MRTRFLNIDHFNPSSTKTLDSLNILHLPIPRLPPVTLSDFNGDEDEILNSCFDSTLIVSSNIDSLPIDGALSKFLSNVLPQFIDVQIGEFSHDLEQKRQGLEKGTEVLAQEKEGEIQRTVGSEISATIIPKVNATTIDAKDNHEFKVFETPQLDLILVDEFSSEKEEIQLLSEVLEDVLVPELHMPYPSKAEVSVYSIENIYTEYHINEEAHVVEDTGSVQDQDCSCHSTFPLLEVGEISPEISWSMFMEDVFLLLLENIGPQTLVESEDLIDKEELVSSIDISLIENFPDHCLKQCLNSGLACLNLFLETEFICITETSNTQGNSASNEQTSGGKSYISANQLLFQEIQILDVYSFQTSEIFSSHLIIDEPKACDKMLMEDMNVRSFNELIVSDELALADDNFKSLPVPVFSDHEYVKSTHVILEEILEDMKPQPVSASDGIYLDWHLLGESECNHDVYCTYKNVLKDLNHCSIDFDLKSVNDRKLMLDFVCSNHTSTNLKLAESKESLNMLPGGTSLLDSHVAGVGSRKKLDNNFPKTGNGEVSSDINADTVSSLLESMSQFNDLDFLLNPRKASAGKNGESVVKGSGSKATPLVQSTDSVAVVELKECNMPNGVSDVGVMHQSTGSAMEGQPHSVQAWDENVDGQKLEGRSNSKHMKDEFNLKSSEAADNLEACSVPLPVPCAPYNMNTTQTQSSMSSFPDKIIVVNTQILDKEMIISRRSTYQKILALEKEGAQVVERDSDFAVDVIVSAEVCLVWYTSSNIGKIATSTDEASSSLPFFVENIATNVLTTLSFAFSDCILVFEGDVSFITAMMESSDALYAAAASLGIDLQLFYSHSSILTDEILLNCIDNATKSTRGLYPRMPESETLAESFLTQFPSINPLSAHAVLSSGGMLIEFLRWSHDHRMRSIRKYHVPEESVALFSALCRYGEREDSKSGMTDCSSSVSSAPESESCRHKMVSERKRQKFTSSPHKFEIPVDNFVPFEPLNGSSVSKQYDFGMSNDLEILSEIKRPGLSLDDKKFSQKQGLDRVAIKDLNWHDISKSEALHEDSIGEIIDFNDRFLFDEDFSSLPSSGVHSPLVNAEKNYSAARNSKTARRLSFGQSSNLTFPAASESNYGSDIWNSVNNHEKDPAARYSKIAGRLSFAKSGNPTFPAALDINNKSDLWNSVKNQEHNFSQDINEHSDTDFNIDNVHLMHREELLGEGSKQNSAKCFNQLSFQQKNVSHFGGTPLRNAIHSSQFQQGSPWTTEFLNRIREKSRLLQQSLPCDISKPGFGPSGSISKINKRKSPSILDFYKYQGGSAPKKLEQKRQKRTLQPSSSSKFEKISARILPTWTPVDKRARQTLAFAVNGSGSQTKLVWSDGNVQHLNQRF